MQMFDNSKQINGNQRPCHTSRIEALQNRNQKQQTTRMLQANASSGTLRQNSMITDSLEGTERKNVQAKTKSQNCQGQIINDGSHQHFLMSNSLKQHVPQQQRAELIQKLAKYIKVSDVNETCISDKGQVIQSSSDQTTMNDIIQENLRKFLHYLEQR